MKHLLLLLPLLTSCLSGSGGSSPAGQVNTTTPVAGTTPVTPTPTPEVSPTPSPTPTPVVSLSYNDLLAKTITYNSKPITFTSTASLQDDRCGTRATITSISSDGTTLTIEAQAVLASYVSPGDEDCAIKFANQNMTSWSFTPGAGHCTSSTAVGFRAEYITYTITRHGSGYSVTRDLHSRPIRRNCVGSIIYDVEYGSMSAEVYE